ncbi:MAG: hypothetical protein AB7I27_03930 [Bacteriovoracaceae bacterium]
MKKLISSTLIACALFTANVHAGEVVGGMTATMGIVALVLSTSMVTGGHPLKTENFQEAVDAISLNDASQISQSLADKLAGLRSSNEALANVDDIELLKALIVIEMSEKK